jgi:hypothetical protein
MAGLYMFGGEGPWDVFVYLFGGIAIFCLLFIDFCIQVLWGFHRVKRGDKISKESELLLFRLEYDFAKACRRSFSGQPSA